MDEKQGENNLLLLRPSYATIKYLCNYLLETNGQKYIFNGSDFYVI